MNPRTLIHICLTGLFALALFYVIGNWKSEAWQDNPMIPLLAIILLAVAGGLAFVLIVLPRIGDAVGTMMYSSGEEVTQDESMKAAAKMAAGDYEGAIEEFEEMQKAKPEDTFPISEIAKICSEKLGEPERALKFLQESLEAHEWKEADAAFLMFRIADVHMTLAAFDDAKDILEQIIGNLPGTRHSANAKHKIQEVEQLQFKLIQAQRALAAEQESQTAEPAPPQEDTPA